ncbi:MAG TPA: NAD-dependent epimerase/dehydratase family protein [Gaiellales bacterium]|nr:NAD-dependent epimerase/dehydratase family protein [Gaiellales bacterium]
MSGRLLVTGGSGFIGSAFVRAVAAGGGRVLNLDAGTYAADERRLAAAPDGAVETVRADIRDDALAGLVARERPRAIVHFAAESHVTRSETAAEGFFAVNVEGTRRVLDAALAAGVPRVLHVSTDEVYGPCPGAPFREQDKLAGEGLATSAYARSKALADDLAQGYADRLDVVVVRPTNTIGPWQHPEKAVPRWTTRALRGERLPVWGDGGQVRDWMYVDDAVGGIRTILEHGRRGAVYNLGPAAEGISNLEIARLIAVAAGGGEDRVYLSHYDRPEHDRRYAVDPARAAALGWRPAYDLPRAIAETVAWYRANRPWWVSLVDDAEALYAD